MRTSFRPARAHLTHISFGLHMRISFWPVHEHLILACACASHFDLRMHISFYLDLHKRISFWPARAHLMCTSFRPARARLHFDLRVRVSFWHARARLSLGLRSANLSLDLRVRISF